ncbi:MAG: DsrE family protein [Betaproteobacteria bacterium]|nr:DsrE family protein [Betaproteobacteria bacterium]
MKQALIGAALLLAAGVGGIQGCATSQPEPKYRFVIQVSEDDPKAWNLALNNAENPAELVGKENVRVEIVAYGPGLKMLKSGSAVADRLNAALDRNVDLAACGVTMKKMKLTQADLIGGARVVSGGLIEIADRQMQGWSYIRP